MNKRTITSHKVNGLNEALIIQAVDQRGSGGANHSYEIRDAHNILLGGCEFQNGPIASPNDINGVSNEALLAVLIDRLEGFQSGKFACRENALALTKLEEAMAWLQKRTRDRMARGVEGMLQA